MENIIPMFIIFSYSLVMNSTAPLLSAFRELYSISIPLSALLPFFMLTGTVLSNIFVSIIINKFGVKKTILTGNIISVIGILLISSSKTFILSLFGLLIFGFSTGFGFTGGTTLLASGKNPKYGFFHGAYGIGGMVAPSIIGLVQRITKNFKDVYYFYAILFVILFLIIKTTETTVKQKYAKNLGNFGNLRNPSNVNNVSNVSKYKEQISDMHSFKVIKEAFRNRNFVLFLFMLVTYSSVEIGTITWAGSTMRNILINSFTAYSLFWLTFTISRFLTDTLSKMHLNLVKTHTIILAILTVLFIISRNPLFFVLSGFFLGPIFPYLQKRGILSIDSSLIPIFNGATYALTSLGGNVVSTLMGVTLGTSILISWLIPLTLIFILNLTSNKIEKY